MSKSSFLAGCLLVSCCVYPLVVLGEDQQDAAKETISLAGGKLRLTMPADWEQKEPKSRIVAYEFAIPAKGDDPAPGRLTVMQAGGGIEANINRWIGQFEQPDGKPTKERTEIEKFEIDGVPVQVVRIRGTFLDRPAPFAQQAIPRANYRMIGAIISMEKVGEFFVKLYGPDGTIAANDEAFAAMIKSLKKGE